MQHQTFEWQATDNQKNFGQVWIPENKTALKGIICIIHGLGEHSSRYQHVAQFFTDNGYAVVSGDLRGHGKSEGKRGHVANYDILLQYTDHLINHARKIFNAQLPVWIYGHSMGGNISLNYAYYKPQNAKGIILSAPFLRVGKPIPAFKLTLAKIMIKIWDAYTENNGINPKDISRTPAVVQNYIADKLVHPYISVRWFFDSYHRAQNLLNNQAPQLTQPLLIMHGTADKLTDHNASVEFAQKAPPDLVTFKSWQGLYHELHNEPEQNEVLQYALNWIERFK